MAITVYSEKDLRNQELLKSLADSANAQSAIVKSQLDSQWSENTPSGLNSFFIQDFSGAGLFGSTSTPAGSWYRIGDLVFLDVSFTFPNNADSQIAEIGILQAYGAPPPPLSNAPASYVGLVFADTTAYKLTMIDSSGDITIDFNDYDGSVLNSDLSDKVISFKAFYKAQ